MPRMPAPLSLKLNVRSLSKADQRIGCGQSPLYAHSCRQNCNEPTAALRTLAKFGLRQIADLQKVDIGLTICAISRR